ncbi:hypothetical protein B0H66DRAFT_575409 [Apodospora peruviana]|uniref:Dihydroorotate dehydrogenase catalytic domain-containing protein n=1 Tax=Apodospora peruviana TaxID=516989 RepID=A0AAE0I5W8_9PEZI|nr:hypothetical protein B0H66DRAFT_575409 [Apodospora peruviana]
MTVQAACRAALRRHAQIFRQHWQQRRAQSSKSDGKTAARPEDPIATPSNVPPLPIWQRLGPLTRAAEAFARAQRKRPLTTQLCSSLVMFACSDLSAQKMGGKDYDPTRTARTVLIGAISSIPAYKWFIFLSQSFNYSSRLLSLATKIVVNQLVFTPVFNTYFFGMQALLAGEDAAAIWERLKRTVPVSFVNAWKLWPAVNAFMFTYVPIEYRSIFSGCVATGWQTYLSYLNRRAEEDASAATEKLDPPRIDALCWLGPVLPLVTMAAPYLRTRHSLSAAFRSRAVPRASLLSHPPSRFGNQNGGSRRHASSSSSATDSLLLARLKIFLFSSSVAASLYVAYYYATDTRALVHRWAVPPLLRLLYPDAEDAHHAGTAALKTLYALNLHPRERAATAAETLPGNPLSVNVFGTELRNPIGISAGLDKNADIPDALFALGAGVVEVGGCTPFPQEGNPKPRVFRVPSLDGLINRYGLNSRGADAMAARLRDRLRKLARGLGLSERDVLDAQGLDGTPPGSLHPGRLLLVQMAKNKTTPEKDVDAVIRDYVYCVDRLAPYADVLVVNVSSPNTPGLRDLQATEPLTRLLSAVVDEARRADRKLKPKVMVKVSPDEDDDTQMEGVVQAVWMSGVDGVIVGNTTKRRQGLVPQGVRLNAKEQKTLTEEGGYSGPALFDQTLNLVGRYRKMLDAYSLQSGEGGAGTAQKVIFATGGITNGDQALKVLNAGASVAMVYTGMVYGGSGTVTRIKSEMREQIAAKKAV